MNAQLGVELPLTLPSGVRGSLSVITSLNSNYRAGRRCCSQVQAQVYLQLGGAADAAPACQQLTAAPQKLLQTGMKAFRTSSLKRQQWQQSASCARQANSFAKTTSGCQATGNKQSWAWVQLGLQGRGPRQQGRKPPAIRQRRAAQALQQFVLVLLKNQSIFTCLKMSENDQKWIFF